MPLPAILQALASLVLFYAIFCVHGSDAIISSVELIYPRDGDRMYPVRCDGDLYGATAIVCFYEIEFMMMIRPSARKDSHVLSARFSGSEADIPSILMPPSSLFDIEVDEANVWGMKDQVGGKSTWIIPIATSDSYIEIDFKVMNQHQSIVYSSRINLLLMLKYDGLTATNLLENDNTVLRGMCSETPAKNCILDFIELGTSSFETIIQRVDKDDTGTDVKSAEYKGISLEAVNHHLQQLPTVRNIIKMNAAISSDKDPRPYANVFFIPFDVVARGGDLKFDYAFLGSNSVDSMHKMLPLYAMKYNTSSRVIQRDTVPRISVSFLFRNYIYEHFSRVNLVKIDIEGMDQEVVHNIIDYHELIGMASLQHMPCVIIYEANGLDAFNASLSLDPFVRGKDPYLLHRLENIGYRIVYVWEYEMMTWSDNYAINCMCSSDELSRATGLLFGKKVPPVIHYGEFSKVCTMERYVMVHPTPDT